MYFFFFFTGHKQMLPKHKDLVWPLKFILIHFPKNSFGAKFTSDNAVWLVSDGGATEITISSLENITIGRKLTFIVIGLVYGYYMFWWYNITKTYIIIGLAFTCKELENCDDLHFED